MNITKNKYLTTRDAAALSGFSPGTLANLRSQKKGCPFFKRGRKVIYETRDFERWLTEYKIQTMDSFE